MMEKAAPDLKPLPDLLSDEEAERFLGTADLSEYDLSGFKPMRFELRPASQEDKQKAERNDR